MATVYKPRILGPRFLERGVAQTVELEVYVGASKSSINGGTYTLYDASGSSAATGSISVVSDVATCTLTPGGGLSYGTGYLEEWALTTASATLPVFRVPAVICKRRPHVPISNADILIRYPRWTDYPTGKTSWDDQIEDAWQVIIGRVINLSHTQPDEVLNTWAFRELAILLAGAMIADVRTTYVSGDAAAEAEELRDRFESEWERTHFDLDTDRDNLIEERGHGSERVQHPRNLNRSW